MKVIAEFVDIRNGNRYGPGDWDKIDPALGDDQVERLKKAGVLSDGADPRASATSAAVGMRTEAGELAARQADAEARDRSQQSSSKETKQGDAASGRPTGSEDGVAGRTKHRHK